MSQTCVPNVSAVCVLYYEHLLHSPNLAEPRRTSPHPLSTSYISHRLQYTRFPTARRLKCLLWKKHLAPRAADVRSSLEAFDAACESVKGSKRLRGLLQVVLELGNRMNQGHGEKEPAKVSGWGVYCCDFLLILVTSCCS